MTHEDNHSFLEWLRGKELEETKEASKYKLPDMSCNAARAKAFREVINHIENNPKELHRCLIPAGWVEI